MTSNFFSNLSISIKIFNDLTNLSLYILFISWACIIVSPASHPKDALTCLRYSFNAYRFVQPSLLMFYENFNLIWQYKLDISLIESLQNLDNIRPIEYKYWLYQTNMVQYFWLYEAVY